MGYRKNHSEVDEQQKEVEREYQNHEFRKNQEKEEIDEVNYLSSDELFERGENNHEIVHISSHKVKIRRRPLSISKWDFMVNLHVNLSSHGLNIISRNYGQLYDKDTPFIYEGLAGNETAIVTPAAERRHYNIPYECLIFPK